MAKKKPLLEQMRDNPRNNWQIADIQRLCDNYQVSCDPPTSGSHYKVHSRYIHGILTIPAHKPIKPIYIKGLVTYIDTHISTLEESNPSLKRR